ncbi:type II toxin-antitoxin system RelE/ParE family toxin [Thermodesulfovibrionales bacterium]|nr:type II toxin-antitoxin system RelE/ParE family toxin [Thermodesulfovibrionales bacterium]
MKYRVIIRPEAENDLKEAFSWHEDKRQGLGYNFLLQVDAGPRFIERNPKICPVEYKRTRKFLIKRFPYKIIYLVEEDRITVLAVIHVKRSPILTKKENR